MAAGCVEGVNDAPFGFDGDQQISLFSSKFA